MHPKRLVQTRRVRPEITRHSWLTKFHQDEAPKFRRPPWQPVTWSDVALAAEACLLNRLQATPNVRPNEQWWWSQHRAKTNSAKFQQGVAQAWTCLHQVDQRATCDARRLPQFRKHVAQHFAHAHRPCRQCRVVFAQPARRPIAAIALLGEYSEPTRQDWTPNE